MLQMARDLCTAPCLLIQCALVPTVQYNNVSKQQIPPTRRVPRAHVGELVALRKGNQMKLQTTWSPSSHTDGRVPWMHSGPRTCTKKAYPERYGAPGDDRSVEETFRPHLFGSKAARVRAPTLLCCALV
jgi:hypothetical protein